MKISIQVIIDYEDGQSVIRPIAKFKRESLVTNMLGLTLDESKIILENLQSEIAQHQVEQHVRKHRLCKHCNKYQATKGNNKVVYRTLFGKLNLKSPRFYMCPCKKRTKKSISCIGLQS